jgi:hypothetical protein
MLLIRKSNKSFFASCLFERTQILANFILGWSSEKGVSFLLTNFVEETLFQKKAYTRPHS